MSVENRESPETPPQESAPAHDLDRCGGGTLRLSWWLSRSRKRVASFQCVTDDDCVALRRLAYVRTRQRGESAARIDTEPSLADLPSWARRVLRQAGYEPVTEIAPP